MSTNTIHQTAAELRSALIAYIEAAYHIGDPGLLQQRRRLLELTGVVHQEPFLESTPRYQGGTRFADISGLPAAALAALQTLTAPDAEGRRVLFDPPYRHQAEALQHALGTPSKNLVITTGTGSGKTESFLMPILGKLAVEASDGTGSFAMPAMRAMVLYPMNALVNDQLTRLRAIFGDKRLVELFKSWGRGRPPRFARYTSRTPYAGQRSVDKDRRNLRPFRDFYIGALESCASDDAETRRDAQRLVGELKSRGKWPAKPDLAAWYGADNARWQDAAGQFKRCVTLPDDSELVTRDEAQRAAPDLLVTNYSMLEYMLMRPVERTIFDQTRAWLAANPNQKFLLVLDEAHLYRGAAGAEVGLLLRRLRDRLDITAERFQVICATASFSDKSKAPAFASQLTGTDPDSFKVIKGDLLLREGPRPADPGETTLLAELDMEAFYSPDRAARTAAIAPVLTKLGFAAGDEPLEPVLHRSLADFGPLALLVNTTMKQAWSLDELAENVFPEASSKETAQRALTNLAALATAARLRPEDPSLLPCRVHTFFRGLRGLWACMNEDCSEVSPTERGVLGKLYTQPIETCRCGARVLELYTCRLCGTAYARGYCSDPDDPTMIWQEPGAELRVSGETSEPLRPIDMLLSPPVVETLARQEFFDLVTGQIKPSRPQRVRSVFLPIQARGRAVSSDEDDAGDAQEVREPGVFYRCGGCNKTNTLAGSPVQDHETKGDQPFQVLVSRQLSLQPPSKDETRFAPLRGRKVLVFSDSRQVAARLAPNLQLFAARDSIRPLLAFGWARLSQVPDLGLQLDDVYCAVLLAAQKLGVRLRPELTASEHFGDYDWVGDQLTEDGFASDDVVRGIWNHLGRNGAPPQSLLVDIMTTMRDRALGLEPLALASIIERAGHTARLSGLPDIPSVTETSDDRLQLARAWLREWHAAGFWLRAMAPYWYRLHPNRKVRITTRSDKFKRFVDRLPSAAAKRVFQEQWKPVLLGTFAQSMERQFQLQGKELSLQFGGDWMRCEDCKSVHRPVRLLPVCPDCGRSNVLPMDPNSDEPFRKRKDYYRQGVIDVLDGARKVPFALVAAEHTAQLNSARKDDVFSKAEVNELLFQDVELPTQGARTSAIDVLSSTTTMEVGIDIGQLSGVALRNMPPARANYQQRAGRAGRRGSAIASVIAFGGSDTHDEHFFSRPADMIAGEVVDPTLSLDNADIARRHLRAFLLQSYIQARIQAGDPGESNLFSVLGTVGGFLRPGSRLNRHDFEAWLGEHAEALRRRAQRWLPTELTDDQRAELMTKMIDDCLDALDESIGQAGDGGNETRDEDGVDGEGPEVQAEVDDAVPTAMPGARNLLDALLYKGILPRYAFPTDVSTFHVFDNAQSTVIRPLFEFAPSQGTPVALSQYAPGKQVWIAGKCYTSGAIYSPMLRDKDANWEDRQLQVECDRCGYTERAQLGGTLSVGERIDCPACRGHETLGPARYWMRPVGFAHPQEQPALVSPEEIPETTYATRAKLIMNSSDALPWETVTNLVRVYQDHKHLLVSNNGPKRRGYNYCRKCGRIEASVSSTGALNAPHPKPYPDPGRQTCRGGLVARDVVLGTDFITDVALFSLKVDDPIRLRPADTITRVALRTLCEALTRAAAECLQIEPGELMAEYRPAVTPSGCDGLEAEIFLYDTLPGGAGFAQQAAQLGPKLFVEARRIMDECPEGCDVSCYRCLRNFRNRLDHGLLDRHVGVALVDYLLKNAIDPFDAQRLSNATGQLFADMERQAPPGSVKVVAEVSDDAGRRYAPAITVASRTGQQHVVYVGNPLCEPEPAREVMINGGQARCAQVSELVVRRSLPEASQQAFRDLAMGD